MDFFNNLFARQQFTSHLLERSFNQPAGWIELALAAALMWFTFWMASRIISRRSASSPKWAFLHHIGQRILWPILLLITAIIGLYLWQSFGFRGVWLQLLVMAARWMILIRLALAVVNAALPDNKITDALERTLATVLWVAFLLWISGIDDIIIHTLKNVELPIGSITLNLYTILTGLLWVAVIMMLALWLARTVNSRLMKSSRLDMNVRIVLSKVITSALVILAILIALPLVGIDLTVLSVFGGALGVGIGFGLQKVASNYISGFIILGDRSIRPGDRLTVDNFTGYVTKITSRFVVLRSAGGVEALIPNETFVTSTVINESYTAKSLWQSLDIQVAYHTDLAQAMQILEAAAAAQERVATDPAPKAFLIEFADNGVNLRVGFWVNDPENGFLGLFSAILLDIWKRFNENDIEFPFPQREVRILNEPQTPDYEAVRHAGQKARADTRSDETFDSDDGVHQ
ncbi:mechanosensitive ion channel [Uruburuella testudinis]|uniref:Mechanosensitive ion channel n=1 Tax=Uruburuella testudinis TaxID=1282863 RepID=A0ABY4DP20_9NEIS|nr:mechanosensitive ion channel domain-containing protein [Uruburuella testudinis]UOO80806.1 mechanosensitive ion channel [Uruburuella testudinis]